MNPFEKINLFLLDMDGTVYLGERWIDGAKGFLSRVRESGRHYAFLTNNASKSRAQYVEKLSRMGLAADENDIITSGEVSAEYLLKAFSDKSVFVLGTDALRNELQERGVRVSDDGEIALLSFHTELTYREMCRICDLVRGGAPYIATHPDFNCPTETGFIPDAGANIAFVHASTGRYPDKVIGKPGSAIIEYALERFGEQTDSAAYIGDRLYTDIAAANAAGVLSVLVLSGETTREMADASETKADIIVNSVSEITNLL